MLNNDNIFMHIHLRNCVEVLGRKIMSGDVLELPHLIDDYALDDTTVALKRFYVVQDVTRASNGFSQTWYPHILRLKCVPMVDTQEFSEILNADAGAGDGTTIGDLMSTYNQSIAINNSIVAQAEADAPLSGYNTAQYYVIPTRGTSVDYLDSDGDGRILDTWDAGDDHTDASNDPMNEDHTVDASMILHSPSKDYYIGYLTGDGKPPNGAPYTFGITFPTQGLVTGQFHLRTDYFPNRLFRYNGTSWIKFEDDVRMTLTNTYDKNTPNTNSSTSTYSTKIRETHKTSFINNNNTTTIAGQIIQERQALSQVLKPRADN